MKQKIIFRGSDPKILSMHWNYYGMRGFAHEGRLLSPVFMTAIHALLAGNAVTAFQLIACQEIGDDKKRLRRACVRSANPFYIPTTRSLLIRMSLPPKKDTKFFHQEGKYALRRHPSVGRAALDVYLKKTRRV